jgi:hypothetical protein
MIHNDAVEATQQTLIDIETAQKDARLVSYVTSIYTI